VEVGWLCWQNTEFLGFLQQNRDFPTALHWVRRQKILIKRCGY
jgi:hypothetical protein